MQHRVARFVVRESDLIVHPRDIVTAASGCQQGRIAGRAPSLQRFGATNPKNAPCGSSRCTTYCPPGTSVGPIRTAPPAALTRSAAGSIAAALK